MWALCFALYGGVKWLTWRRRVSGATRVPWWQHVAYFVGWPGLDAAAFLAPADSPRVACPSRGEWLFAAAKCSAGATVLAYLPRLIDAGVVPFDEPLVQAWSGMIGVILVLHFGLFHLIACGWRSVGIDARPIMDWPLAAASVSAFWGRRWNKAFRDIAYPFVFRPLSKKLGPRRGWPVVFWRAD